MQLSSKEHFQLIVFQKLWDWRLEKFCMRNHTCLLDNHQRSHYDTITIGPEGKFNWVLQLINSEKVRLFGSLEEKFNTKRSPNQPNQSQNQSVIDQGNLIAQMMCLLLKVKRPVPMRSDNEFNRAINEENIDFNIPGLPHSTVKRSHGVNVQNLIQKIENDPQRHALQSDLQQRRQFNPFSKESQDMIKAAGNIELCELLDVEPKAQCIVCLSFWNVGIVYCSCGHFLRNGTEENKKFMKYTLDLFSIPNYYIKKGRPHGHRYGKKPGDHEYFIANSLKKKCKKREFLGIHDRFIRDARFRKTMIELGRSEELCREMDKLANEDHTHHATEEEISVYRNNWWIRSNFVGSDTMPVRHRADFKQALSTLRHLKDKEDAAHQQRWESYSSSWWNWQDSWWHSSSEYHRDNGPSTDRSGKPDRRWLGQLFVEWVSKWIWCRITVTIR